MSLKSNLIIVPVIWNLIILIVYAGFPIVAFVTLFSSLMGVAIGLAIAAGVRLFGSGISDESVHLAFIVGTLSGFYGLMSLGVLLGQGTTTAHITPGWGGNPGSSWINIWGINQMLQEHNGTLNAQYAFPQGGGETFLGNFPYGWVIQSIMGMAFLLGIILWCTRSD